MNELQKKYGNSSVVKSILGLLVYTLLAMFVIFVVKFAYEFIMLKIGFSLIILDIFIWVMIAGASFVVANYAIRVVKIENAKSFYKYTLIASIPLVLTYYVTTIMVVFAEIGILSQVSLGDMISVIPDLFSEGISISRRSSGFTLPAFTNYIFAFIVWAGFALPRGKFDFNKKVYIDGEAVTFKKYNLFTKEELSLASITTANDVYVLSDEDVQGEKFYQGYYNSLYVSENPNHRVCNMLVGELKNSKGVLSLQLDNEADYYYDTPFDHQTVAMKLKPYSQLAQVSSEPINETIAEETTAEETVAEETV